MTNLSDDTGAMTQYKEPTGPIDETTQLIRIDDLDEKLRQTEKVPALLVIDGNDTGRIFKLTSSAMSLGRGTAVSIRLNDKAISRKHCLVETTPNHVTVIDLQSSNGTLVNGEKIKKKRLENGDKIRIGNSTLKFEMADADESEFHEKLYHLITFDELTSLYNRKYLITRLEFIFKSKKQTVPVTILFLDLDHFKLINDNYDHLTGSEVLSEFGRVLLSNLRSADIACRYGGEEFIIILQDTIALQAIYVAEKLRKLVEGHRFLSRDGHVIQVTVSIGIAEKTPSISTYEDLIARADSAMYKAKENGRNRTVLYKEDESHPYVVVTPADMDESTPHGTHI